MRRTVSLAVALVLVAPASAWAEGGAKRKTVKVPPPPPAPLYEGADPAAERTAQLTSAVTDLDSQLVFAKSKVKVNEEYLSKLVAYESEWSAHLARLQARIADAQRNLSLTVTRLYQRAADPAPSVYAAVIGADSPKEAVTATRYVAGVLRDGRTQVGELIRLRDEAELVTREASAKTAEVRATSEGLAAQRKQLESLRNQVAAARKRKVAPTYLTSAEKKERALLAKVEASKEQYLREVALLHAESSAIASWLRGIQGKQRIALRRRGTFQMPAAGRLSSGFGLRTHPVYGDTRVHTGADFSAPAGTPIVAAGPGRVLWASGRGGYGNLVVIDHGNGLATLYAHQSKILVAVDQVVAAGDVIGQVGSTGLSTGPHLHFEVREKGSPLDPFYYL